MDAHGNDPSHVDGQSDLLQEVMAQLEARVARLERFFPDGGSPLPARGPVPTRVPAAPRLQRPATPDRTLGRLIAWAGGFALVTGLVLLVGLAVERGWIGPGVGFGLGIGLGAISTALSVYLSAARRGSAALGRTWGGIAGSPPVSRRPGACSKARAW